MENEKILHAFPTSLRQEVETVIMVLPADKNVQLFDGRLHQVDSLIHPNEQIVLLNDEVLKIPSRVYFSEPMPDREKELTDLQKTILNCIYLRHHNGFIRQKRLELLVDKTNYFIIPYIFQLLGEYVIEILEVLDKHVNEKTISYYIKFICDNKKYWQQTEGRMINYWHEYYRRQNFPKLKDYIGKQIIDRLKKANVQQELSAKVKKQKQN